MRWSPIIRRPHPWNGPENSRAAIRGVGGRNLRPLQEVLPRISEWKQTVRSSRGNREEALLVLFCRSVPDSKDCRTHQEPHEDGDERGRRRGSLHLPRRWKTNCGKRLSSGDSQILVNNSPSATAHRPPPLCYSTKGLAPGNAQCRGSLRRRSRPCHFAHHTSHTSHIER